MEPRTPIPPALIDDWRVRQRALTELEHRDEPEGWQWLCRIRLRILGYLLARYGDDAPAAPTPPAPSVHPAARLTAEANRSPATALVYAPDVPTSAEAVADDALPNHPPRHAAELAGTLGRIAERHEPVRAAFLYIAEMERVQADQVRRAEGQRRWQELRAWEAARQRAAARAERRRELGWRWFFTPDA